MIKGKTKTALILFVISILVFVFGFISKLEHWGILIYYLSLILAIVLLVISVFILIRK